MSDGVNVLVLEGVEGLSVYLNNVRVAGSKPWGGGDVLFEATATRQDIDRALERCPRCGKRSGVRPGAAMQRSGRYVPCYGDATCQHTGAPDDAESRRWCHDCSEWCYPGDPDMLCVHGRESHLRSRITSLEAQLTQERTWAQDTAREKVLLRERITSLEAEREKAWRNSDKWRLHANNREARIERLEKALRDILDLMGPGDHEAGWPVHAQRITRRALSPDPTTSEVTE